MSLLLVGRVLAPGGASSFRAAMSGGEAATARPTPPARPPEWQTFDAVATRGDRIVAVGSEAHCQREAPGARRIETAGWIVPGFHDAHTHLLDHGVRLLRLNLAACRSVDEIFDAVRERARMTPSDGWVVGYGWDESRFDEPRLPTREALDRAAEGRRVLLHRVDMHMAAASSAAMRAAKVWADDGLVREEDAAAVGAAAKPAKETVVRGLERAIRESWRLGITSVHAIVDREQLDILADARRRGALGVRVGCFVREADALSPGFDLASYPRDAWLRVLGVKLFADGSIGSHTAGLSRPFIDQAETRGRLLFTPDGLRERIRAILGRGLQPAVHAIGDAAIDEVVRCYEAEGVTSESRARIEHFELAGDGAIAACARMGVVASMQPNFIGEWGYPGMMYERRLGKDIVGTHNRLRAIADAGVPLAFGSDHMPYGPLYGLRHAVHGPAPAQRLSPVEALRAYTEGSAYAGFEEQEKGSILPGLLADIVILSEEAEGGPAPRERSAPSGPFGADLGGLVVEKTIVAGEVVYEAPRAAS